MDLDDKMRRMKAQSEAIMRRHQEILAENAENKDWQRRHNADSSVYLMTGHERIQYNKWKAEREGIDNQRMSRQTANSGNWIREWDQGKEGSGRAAKKPEFPDHLNAQLKMHSPQTSDSRRHPQLAPLPIQPQNSMFEETRIEFVSGRGRGRSRNQFDLTGTNCASALAGKEEIVSGRGRGRKSLSIPLHSPGVKASPGEGAYAFGSGQNDTDLKRADSLTRLDSFSDEFSCGVSNWADLPTPTLLRRGPPTF